MSGFLASRGVEPDLVARVAGCEAEQYAGWTVASWGLAETRIAGEAQGERPCRFVAVGVGALLEGGSLRMLDARAWSARLGDERPRVGDLEGHWAFVRMWESGADACCDPVGQRALFYAQDGAGLVVSSSESHVALLLGRGVDVDALGQAVRLVNPVEVCSYVYGVERVPPGYRLVIGERSVALEPAVEIGWSAEATPDHATAVLASATRLASWDGSGQVSLGLSGGFDSRVLAALAPPATHLHTFGPDSADAQTAAQIAGALGRPLRRIPHPQASDSDRAWQQMLTFSGQVGIALPATAAFELGPYDGLHASGLRIVDGGLGEIVRRRYLTRMPADRLHPDHAPFVASHLARVTHDFWSDEARRMLDASLLPRVERVLSGLPAAIRADQRVDAFALRTRVWGTPHYGQARLDGQVVCLSPYLQPSVLRAAFGLPRRERRGRWMAQAVRRHSAGLARIRLAKAGTRYPFGWPHEAVSAWLMVRARMRGWPGPTHAERVLRVVEPQVRDLAAQAAGDGLYDRNRLLGAVDRLYASGVGAGVLSYWLGFELWRRGLRAASR